VLVDALQDCRSDFACRSIAVGTAIRERKRLWKNYGKGRWRKLKGMAKVEFTRWYDMRS
jgi:hypothetical protein